MIKFPATFLWIITLFLAGTVAGQTRFTATTDRTKIAKGEQVVITATLITSKKIRNLAIPQIPQDEAYSILKTDSRQSSSSSIQIINGKTSRTTEITTQFYYVITARKTGTFTFPALTVSIEGKVFRTSPLRFSVTDQPVANPDVRVFLQLSKKKLYPGQQAVLTFKVAQRAQAQNQSDVTKGFNAVLEKIDNAFSGNFALTRLFTNQVTSGSERIDGEIYKTYSLRYLLFPLSTGTYAIDRIPYDYQELHRARRQGRSDPFYDDFFGGDFFGGRVQAIGKTIATAPLTITVRQLPPPPSGFSGAVGEFSLSAKATPRDIPAGESVTLKISFKGNTRPGNMGDITVPKSDAYELFTPEKQMSVDTGTAGISTRKTYKYLLIPRKKGTLTLEPVTFTYFDPKTESYKKAASSPITLNVTRGKGIQQKQTRYLTQEEIRAIGKDIRYIKTDVALRSQSRFAYREPLFYLLFPLPFILILLSLLYRFQSERRDKTAAKQIRNKALATAFRQIAQVRKQAATLKPADFLRHVASTIETYISQKFSFAATGRTLDELKEELSRSTADDSTVSNLAAFIEKIDSYRFGGATLDDASRLTILAQAEKFLSGLEKSARKEKNGMKNVAALLLLCSVLIATPHSAPTGHWFDQANGFYADGVFDSAAVTYEKIIESGTENSAVYFNYGNALYRLGKLGPARLAYERAAMLDPNDPDISTNIKFLASNIVDRVPEPERTFLDALVWKLHTLFTLKAQLWIAFVLLTCISITVSLSFFTSRNKRLWLIYLSVLTGLLFSGVAASVAYKIYAAEKISYAIVLSTAIEARNEPKGATVIFTAHEGTKFRIRKEVDTWALVSLPNGISGWVEMKDIGKI